MNHPKRLPWTPDEAREKLRQVQDQIAHKRPKFEAIAQRFLRAVRETKPIYDTLVREWGELLIYPVFEGGFWPHTMVLLELGEDEDQVRRIFAFVEEMACSDDPDIIDLAAIGFLNNVLNDRVSGLAWHFMGPKSRDIWLEDAMALVGGGRSADVDRKYHDAWRAEMDRQGGVQQLTVTDAFELRRRMKKGYPDLPRNFRTDFRNWDPHAFLNLDEYRSRLLSALDDSLGDTSDWYHWLTKLRDARERLLRDRRLKRK